MSTASNKGIDAHDANGTSVEIKATTASRGVALRGMEPTAERLIVLQIDKTGEATEIYAGAASPVWEDAGAMQSNGQSFISLNRLRELQP